MKRGFSLLEVIVATVILATITGTTVEILRQGYRASAESQNRTIAYNLAREKLEEYYGYSSGTTEDYGTIANFRNFKRVVTINWNPYPYGYPPTYYLGLITVTVYWNNDRNSQSFSTLWSYY